MITITVCIGSSCHLKCSYDVVTELQNLIKLHQVEDRVTVKASFCLGNCTRSVSVKLDDGEVQSVSKDDIIDFFKENILDRLPQYS